MNTKEKLEILEGYATRELTTKRTNVEIGITLLNSKLTLFLSLCHLTTIMFIGLFTIVVNIFNYDSYKIGTITVIFSLIFIILAKKIYDVRKDIDVITKNAIEDGNKHIEAIRKGAELVKNS